MTLAIACALLVAQTDPDPWFGRDKAEHFAATSALAVVGYTGSAVFFERESTRALVGGSLAMGAGIAKELWDLAGHGDPSWRDLTWDAIGTAFGLLISWSVDHFLWHPRRIEGAKTAPSHAPP